MDLKQSDRTEISPPSLEKNLVGAERENKTAESRKSLLRNWHIGALLLAIAVSFMGFGIVSPLRTLYARSEGVSAGEVGLMGATYLFSTFIFLFPFGWLSDRYSRVNLIVMGLAAHAAITILFMIAESGSAFIALRFLEGITSAAVLPAARALLADLVPPGRNGEAFGLMSACMTFGIMAGPPAGTFLAAGFNYSTAYWIAALIFVPAIVLVWLAFKNYRPRSAQAQNVDIIVSAVGEHPPAPVHLWTVPVVIGCLVRVALGFGPGLGISIWSIYMADLGFGLTLIGWTYTVYAIPALLVAPSAGRLSDRYGRLGMMFVGSLAVALLWGAYGIVTSFVLIMVMGIIEGSLDAVARSANDGYLADHSPPQSRGQAQAVFNGATQLGSLISALAAGFIYEINHGLPFIATGVAQVVLVLIALVLALVYHRNRRQSVSMA